MILSHQPYQEDANRKAALLLVNDLLQQIPTNVLLDLLFELAELATIPASPGPPVT